MDHRFAYTGFQQVATGLLGFNRNRTCDLCKKKSIDTLLILLETGGQLAKAVACTRNKKNARDWAQVVGPNRNHDLQIYTAPSARGGLGLKTGPGNFHLPLYRPYLHCNFHSNGPTQAKSKKSPVFHTKITPLSLQTHRPTGHCPNASMTSPPLAPTKVTSRRPAYSQALD